METNYKQKIYAFFTNCEYNLITRISESKYGIVTLFTDSFGMEEFESETLEEAIELCRKSWDVVEFNNYKEFFEWCLTQESEFDFMDFWGVKNITGRHFYIEDHGKKIQKIREQHNDFTIKVPDYSDC